MKKITIPQSVQIETLNKETNTVETVEFGFSQFLINNALVHPVFGQTIESLEKSQSLEQTLATAQVGDVVEVEDDMWEALNSVVNYPKNPYSDIRMARKLLPFMRAIKYAENG